MQGAILVTALTMVENRDTSIGHREMQVQLLPSREARSLTVRA